MKKIINGKLYDTDTAKEIGFNYHGDNPRDFHYYCERLYRKKTGEYFLHGEGGPMTRYAKSVGQNQWTGGERIEPMTLAAAKEWAERELTADEYQAEFGEITEDDTRTTMVLSISVSTAERIRRAAQENGITMSALIESMFDGNK